MGEARSRFESAVGRCDNDQYARTGLGYVALRQGNTAEARALLETVVQAEPNNVDALVGLGLASWREGDLDQVRERFERVVRLTPDHPTALEYLERLEGAVADPTAPRDAADQAWLDGNTELAFELYSARLDRDPTDGLALLRAGLVHAWSERYAAALELLDLLVDLEPTNMDGRLARARVHAWSGDTSRALSDVGQILEVQPDNADALAALGLFQSWTGRIDEALESYDQLLSIAPAHGAGQRQRAQALGWAAAHDQSLASYRALVEASPDDADARIGYAAALGFAGRYDEAIAQYDHVLSGRPDDMRARTGRATVLGWAGRLVESERAALGAVELDGASADAWAALGQAYQWQARDAEALEAFEVAAGFAPSDAEIRDQLRSVRRGFAPVARPTVTAERDSDGNRMLTMAATASLHATPSLKVLGSAYRRGLRQEFLIGTLERTAFGGMVDAEYQLRPGWTLSAGLGGSVTDGADDPSFLAYSVGATSPQRHPLVLSLEASSFGLDETAALAERGVRASDVRLTARWTPVPLWRVDAYVGQGSYQGTESNGRRSGFLAVSRRVGRFFSVGSSFRGFTFEKNVNDGYFDPDVYWVGELTGYWLHRPAPWSFLIEAAPGVQKVRRDGDTSGSIRASGRVGYQVAAGREVSMSYGYSTAGLTSSATGDDGYNYSALIIGFRWIF